jgi:general secretion pathway protein G
MNARRGRAAARGFTLIEMVAVLTIVAILALAAQPLHELVLRRTQEQALRSALRALRGAIDEHRRAVEGGLIARGKEGSPYPANLQSLVAGVPLVDEKGQPRADGSRLYLLRRLPRDPFADPALAAAETWSLRASTSPPEAPRPGHDVFDLSSRCEAVALDGSRYRDW